ISVPVARDVSVARNVPVARGVSVAHRSAQAAVTVTARGGHARASGAADHPSSTISLNQALLAGARRRVAHAGRTIFTRRTEIDTHCVLAALPRTAVVFIDTSHRVAVADISVAAPAVERPHFVISAATRSEGC